MADGLARFTSAMDRLYEFDREPVTPDKFQSGGKFAGLFAGEHVAATEFVIGAFFVLHGVTVRDLLLGLLVGNLLAVLSWTFLCAPIAVRTRLTLYWYLRKIAGPGVTFIYNIANAFLYCILAGAMISVSATAVGILLGIKVPALDAVLPTSAGWVAIVLVLGAAFTTMAILGFEKLSRFAQVASPWIFAAFIAGALAGLSKLGAARDLSNLGQVVTSRVWNGVAEAGQEKFGFGHVLNVGCDPPHVAAHILDAAASVAIELICGFHQRGRARLDRAPVDAIGVGHVQVEHGRHGFPRRSRLAKHHARIADLKLGAKVFADNCAVCHGPDAKGKRSVGSPNLTDKIWLYGPELQTIIDGVWNGHGGVMPAWGAKLDDVTIKALTVYVHTFGGGEK